MELCHGGVRPPIGVCGLCPPHAVVASAADLLPRMLLDFRLPSAVPSSSEV